MEYAIGYPSGTFFYFDERLTGYVDSNSVAHRIVWARVLCNIFGIAKVNAATVHLRCGERLSVTIKKLRVDSGAPASCLACFLAEP